MKNFSQLLTTGAVAIAGAVTLNTVTAFNASALTLYSTQTFYTRVAPPGFNTTGPAQELPTVWQRTFNPLKYNGASPLAQAVLTLSGTATSTLTATTTSSSPASVRTPSQLGAAIDASSTAIGNSLNLNLLPSGQVTPVNVTIPGNGGSRTFTDVKGSETQSQTFTTGLTPFIGAGTFDFTLDTAGSSALVTVGGNIATSQTTTASGVLTVQYYIADAPPPVSTPESSNVLGLLAIVGVGTGAIIRRRKS